MLAAVTPPPDRDREPSSKRCSGGPSWAARSPPTRRIPPRCSPIGAAGAASIPENPPATIYVSWQLSAEAQQAVCNWKYDVASRRASALSPAEAADVAQRIVDGTIGPQERAFFHTVGKSGGRLAVTAGYCWGSAAGLFEFRSGNPVLIGELAIHGY